MTVRGTGLLADAVASALADGPWPSGPDDPAASDPAVVVGTCDGWVDPPEPTGPAVRLEVWTEIGRVRIGPTYTPGAPGCQVCVALRRERNRVDRDGLAAVIDRNRDRLADTSPLLDPLAAHVVASLVAFDVEAILDGRDPRTASAVLDLDLGDLSVTRHTFLPDPLCPRCGQLPDDSAELAAIVLRPRAKVATGALRTSDVAARRAAVMSAYVGPELGLVGEVRTGDSGGLPVADAPLTIRATTATEAGWGRGDSYRASELTAVLEAVERWGGLQAGGRRTNIHGSYRDLADHAVDPRTLGVHAPASYGAESFPFVPFDEDLAVPWVWAHSLVHDRQVLLPESYCYYGAHLLAPVEPRFQYEISNGCALGGCLEEAVLHGLLEVAERDAFLMAWYARRPLPRVDLASASDPTIGLLVEHLTETLDKTISVFDTTLEQGIPSVWILAVDRSGDAAHAVCAAGAHLDPERAVLDALTELGPIAASVDRSLRENPDHAARLANDSTPVATMADHSLLYAGASVSSRLDFLGASNRTRTLAEMSAAGVPISPGDLTDDLLAVVARYRDTGLDVIVVDQTTDEHRAAGFSCVKVVVPGTLPMTFGQAMRRTTGLPRLFSVPGALGDPRPPSTADDLNSHPHPFP